jgi:hypothetical protein
MATPPTFSCGYASTGASAEVSNHIQLVNDYTNTAFAATLAATSELQSVVIPDISLNVDLENVPSADFSEAPDAPELEEISLEPELYDVAEFVAGDLPPPISFTTIPTRPDDPPVPSTILEPTFTDVTIDDAPTVTFEDAPDFVPVDAPILGDLLSITIPDFPVELVVEFEGVRPDVNLAAPANTFSFEEDEYSSEVVDAVTAKLLEIFNNGTGLPVAVAQAMRDSAYTEVDRNAEQARQQVDEEMASRGFNLPNGMLLAARRKVTYEAQRERNKLSRDIYIKEVDVQIDMLKTAMSTGIALEDVLIRLHISVMERRLQAARATIEAAINIFNARVQLENIKQALYVADAQVFEARLRGEQLKLERVKTQIEAEALKGQINEQTVKIYTEGFRALEANAQVYRSIIDGFKAKTDAKRAIIDGYTAYVQGQKAIVETNVAKAQFYAEKVRAEGLKQENYKIRAETYSAAIQGWSQASQAEIERYKAELQRLEIEARSYSTMLERQKFLLDVERTRIGAIGNDNQALVGAYGIASNAAISANEGKVRRVLALLEEAKAKSQIALQNGEINIRNGISATDLELRKYETLSQVFSNLTASFAAAINVNAGIQDTASSSQSCGQNVNFSTTFD